MDGQARPGGGGVAPRLAVVFATVGYLALAIAGLGVASLLLDADIIGVPGLGQVPGVAGMLLSAAAFATAMLIGLRAQHPSLWTAPVAALAAWLGEAIGVGVGGIAVGADVARVAAAVGGVAAGWPGLVLVAAALVAGCGGVALVRTRGDRAHWPWERDED